MNEIYLFHRINSTIFPVLATIPTRTIYSVRSTLLHEQLRIYICSLRQAHQELVSPKYSLCLRLVNVITSTSVNLSLSILDFNAKIQRNWLNKGMSKNGMIEFKLRFSGLCQRIGAVGLSILLKSHQSSVIADNT